MHLEDSSEWAASKHKGAHSPTVSCFSLSESHAFEITLDMPSSLSLRQEIKLHFGEKKNVDNQPMAKRGGGGACPETPLEMLYAIGAFFLHIHNHSKSATP